MITDINVVWDSGTLSYGEEGPTVAQKLTIPHTDLKNDAEVTAGY